jgi:hypothetical protein
MLVIRHGWGVRMTKGWEFFWEGRRYCVGAPDAPTARRYLRAHYPAVAQHARSPKELAGVIAAGLQLKEGTVRVMSGMSGTRPT